MTSEQEELDFGFTDDLEFWIDRRYPQTQDQPTIEELTPEDDEQIEFDKENISQQYHNHIQNILDGGGFNQ